MILGDGPPALGEYEVNLFGPSYGEALAIHIGDGKWILIDSCMEADKIPTTAKYLDDIGVKADDVVGIIASHWHDDHIKGLSQLVEKYSAAAFFVPNFFSEKEGMDYLAAYSGYGPPQARGTRELFRAIELTEPIPTGERVLIFDGALAGQKVSAVALSPVPAAWGKATAALLSKLPTVHQQIKHATSPGPNFASVVVHIALGADAILLGSDLEAHTTMGWQAVVASNFSVARGKASLFKVAHHGSSTAHLADVWEKLLVSKPVAAVTPYVNGSTSIPDPEGIARLKGLACALYCTSQGSLKAQMGTQAEQLLKSIGTNVRVANRRMGHWRFRKTSGGTEWAAKAGGAAVVL